MSTMSLSKSTENEHDVCRGIDCMKKFCEFLREMKMKLLTNKQQKSYENAKFFYISQEKSDNKYAQDTKYVKLGSIVIIQVYILVLHIVYLL